MHVTLQVISNFIGRLHINADENW